MNTEKNLTADEKETVQFILAELSEQYQQNIKNMAALVSEVKELTAKIQQVINNQEEQKRPGNNPATLIKNGLEKLESIAHRVSFPGKAIQELYRKLSAVSSQLSQPLQQKVEHHHHVHKIIGITAGLFIIVCFLCLSWYNTGQKLAGFRENDTKYRLLRLDTAFTPMQRYLDKVDQAYTRNPKLRDSVIAKEEENKRNMELLIEAYNKNREAERLKSEASEIRKAAGQK